MAFKIDFSKINNRTPEEKEADRKEMHEKFEARITSKIVACRFKIDGLIAHVEMMPEKSAKFVRDLAYQSTTFDTDGRPGGRLYDLSSKQVVYLESLYQEYVESALVIKNADVESGHYCGQVINNVGGKVVQNQGRGSAISHEKANLDSIVEVGKKVDIKYSHGHGKVKSLEIGIGDVER